MKVGVCVPFRARNEHETRVWAWVQARWRAHFPDWQVAVADSGHVPFNRSASRNRAAELMPDAEVLVFSNSDTIHADPTDLLTAVDIATAGGWTLPSLYVEESEQWTTEALQLPPDGPIPDPLSSYDRRLANAIAGPQVVSRGWWEDVGRWDEAFLGWGWEDKALRDALTVLHAPPTYCGTAVHLWHPRGKAESPQANARNRARWAQVYGRAGRQRDATVRVAMMRAATATNRPNSTSQG